MRKSALFWFGLVITALVALGLVVLSSASMANAVRFHHGDAYFFIRRQFEYLAAGLVVATLAAMFDYRKWRDYPWLSWLVYAVVLVLLCVVLKSRAINGSHRWLDLGILRVQPSEFAKLMTVIIVSVWMDRAGWRVELFTRGVILPMLLIALLGVPIVLEPDFGSVMVIGLVGCLIMFVAGARLMHLLPPAALGVFAVSVLIYFNPNRMKRLFDDEMLYQVKAALAAIGRGGIWGVGLGESMQKHYYLPEAHTDFVFAIGAEELGLFFSVAVILLFLAFFALSVYIARNASDRFGRLLVIGMAFIIFFQAMFNLGVVCGVLPTKGMALPFFSYGGTNLLSAFFAVGTILSVGIHSYRDRRHQFLRKVILK